MFQRTPAVIIPAKSCHQASVIWLHGLGADGHDFEPIVPQLNVDHLGIKFIFPNALAQPVTINGGMVMPSWYDIVGVELDSRADENGILDSVTFVNQLIQAEIDLGISPEKIIVAGFSQGGVVALHTALTYKHKLAGVIALSTYLPLTNKLQPKLSVANQQLPIFHAHGSMDPVVPPQLADHLVKQLQQWHYPIESHRYPMQHAVCPEEISQISVWIKNMIG